MKTLLTILITMSLMTSCNRNEASTTTITQYHREEKLLNVAYGKDSLQTMDIYLPAGRSLDSTPSLILVHGGGWNGGSRSEFRAYIDSFQKRMPHYAIFNLDYRLVNGGNLFPTQEIDVKTAVDHITARQKEYGINAGKFVLLGTSAGGHLALLQAYKYNEPRVKAVVDFFGPTDLLTMYERPWHPLVPYALQMITGSSPSGNKELYRQSSPVSFVDASAPPTLIFHGAYDPVVDISQSHALKRRLDAAGVTNELVVYPNERHGWQGKTLTHSFNAIESFLRQHVR